MDTFKYVRTGNQVEIEASGGLGDVIAEISYMIHKIYAGIKSQNPEAAEVFAYGLRRALASGIPTWKDAKPVDGETMIAIVQEAQGGDEH